MGLHLRVRWLRIRRRILPWCMVPGCWEPSHVLVTKTRPLHRGNLCAVHFWEHLQEALSEEQDVWHGE